MERVTRQSPDDIEVQLLTDAIYRLYGYDFRNYALASLKRRIYNFLKHEGLPNISALQERILYDQDYVDCLLASLTVHTTAMFRDPSFYLAFREKVVPILRTYPFIRIWHAGCSTGQEVYSMAILLQEAGIYSRCRIYATDISDTALQVAKSGIYPYKPMQEYTQLYLKAGGERSFSEYYTANHGNAVLRSSLQQNIVFGQHNLVTDRSFNEFNVIICRNVLMYFKPTLQDQVHELFYNSLCKFGILGLGKHETLRFTRYQDHYEAIVKAEKIYRRRN